VTITISIFTKKAKSVVNYIINQKGIKKGKIFAKG